MKSISHTCPACKTEIVVSPAEIDSVTKCPHCCENFIPGTDTVTKSEPRKFYRRTMKVEFLSETPFGSIGLSSMVNEAIEGDYSMGISQEADYEITGRQAAHYLLKHGSDPSFFRLTPNGKDAE
jgi:hypothetical protein